MRLNLPVTSNEKILSDGRTIVKSIALARRVDTGMGPIALLTIAASIKAFAIDPHSAVAVYFWHSMYGAIINPSQDITTAARVMAAGSV